MSVKKAESPPSSPPVGPRIRNKGIRKVRVGDLLEAEWNPATHSDFQGECLDGSIAEIGFIGYPDVFELPDGTLKLWDGHLRKSRLLAVYGADAEIEVAVCDLSEPEAKKAALLKDPIAAMREHDAAKLDELLREVETGSEALAKMMDELAQENGIVPGEESETVLKQLDTKAPPKMTWTLIGIPTVRFGEIAETIEHLANIPDAILEMAATDG